MITTKTRTNPPRRQSYFWRYVALWLLIQIMLAAQVHVFQYNDAANRNPRGCTPKEISPALYTTLVLGAPLFVIIPNNQEFERFCRSLPVEQGTK